MDFYTASDARQNLFQLINQVATSHNPICIGSKRNSVVVMSTEDFKALQETLYLYGCPGFVESIQEARRMPKEQRLTQLDWDEE